MAEDVSILQEIDDALRVDRASQFWANNSGTIITFCVLLVLSTAASSFWKSHMRGVHEAETTLMAKAMLLLETGKNDDAIKNFEQIEKDGGPLAAFAGLRHAQALMLMHQMDQAIAQYNDIASGRRDNATDVLRDFAAVEADILAHDQAIATGKPAVPTEGGKEARQPGRPFASALAEMDALRAHDAKSAAALLNSVVSDKDAPMTQRIRAAQLTAYLGDPAK